MLFPKVGGAKLDEYAITPVASRSEEWLATCLGLRRGAEFATRHRSKRSKALVAQARCHPPDGLAVGLASCCGQKPKPAAPSAE